MKAIKVHDPSMCCSSGICGNNIDPDPANSATMLAQLGKRGSQPLTSHPEAGKVIRRVIFEMASQPPAVAAVVDELRLLNP